MNNTRMILDSKFNPEISINSGQMFLWENLKIHGMAHMETIF